MNTTRKTSIVSERSAAVRRSLLNWVALGCTACVLFCLWVLNSGSRDVNVEPRLAIPLAPVPDMENREIDEVVSGGNSNAKIESTSSGGSQNYWLLLARRDLLLCRQEMEKTLNPNAVKSTFRRVAEQLCVEDIANLPLAMSVTHNQVEKSMLSSSVLQTCAKANLDSFIAGTLKSLNGGLRTDAVVAGVYRSIELRRIGVAVDLIAEIPPSTVRSQTLLTIATEWAKENPEAALNWANTNSNSADSRVVEQGIVSQVARTVDIERAFAIADLVRDDVAKGDFISIISERLSQSDVSETHKWIESLPKQWRSIAERKYVPALAQTDISAATTYALSREDEASRAFAIDSIARVASKNDLDRAKNWINAVPDAYSDRALIVILNEIAPKDHKGAVLWVDGIKSAKLRDKGYRLVSEYLAGVGADKSDDASRMLQERTSTTR